MIAATANCGFCKMPGLPTGILPQYSNQDFIVAENGMAISLACEAQVGFATKHTTTVREHDAKTDP
jgi:hypothetical protein